MLKRLVFTTATLAAISIVAGCGRQSVGSVPEAANSSLDANNWGHVRLIASDGTRIGIDFQCFHCLAPSDGLEEAGQIHINVGGPGHAVRAVLLEKAEKPLFQPAGEIIISNETYDLQQHDDGHFSFEIPGSRDLKPSYFTGGRLGVQYGERWQEIAVVKDGTWLKDPVSGGSNFRFSWRQAAGLP